MYKQLNRISMKQLIIKLNDSLGKTAYATKGSSENSISVYPLPDYDFFPQVAIERLLTFCREHNLHFYIDMKMEFIDVYNPALEVPSIDSL